VPKRSLIVKLLFPVLALVIAASAGPAGAAGACSSEVLKIRDVPVTVQYCLTGTPTQSGPEMLVPVQGNYSSATGSFSRASTMRFVTGEGPARVLENVDLAGLGLGGTLHLTLAYDDGLVKIENAMLTPGAITIK
jgi:hypothetical protein